MPKIVDHEARRGEIIEAVWSLISSRGFQSVTMRELAAVAGYANGALTRYFPDKNAVLRAAFRRAYDATNERAGAAIGDRGGLAALRLLCLEIMPLDDVRLREARVVIGFWDHAVGHADLVEFFESTMVEWRDQVRVYLRQARATGEVPAGRSDDVVVDGLLAMLMGLQINALFMPRDTTPARQLAMLDGFLDSLRGR
ncbi:TetR/AcrR family transcriptional regulator [Pseudonocardia humida]|uniref:TetR/AcrR family transcriptional regulator n=1 Tax=Pseudonocardia humida TaxID=2800819 RepID=A0ABT0ZZF6_9PSEU|nr:TetR/AcrR family transcriptional regulator [Pseudonocardia humida]MCO1656139.1 TetR/AcrR family transcriptional regulator [Pseudonocardia humida]